MFHFIFDYNYDNFWQILIIFLPHETGMNTLPNLYKLFHFNLTMCPLYVVKLQMTQKTADRLCSAFCWTDCSRLLEKVVQCSFFLYMLEHFFSSLQTKKNLLHSRWFYQKFIFKLNVVNFNMYN